MTDEQVQSYLRAIRNVAETLNGEGYHTALHAPTQAALDVRFLLAHFDRPNHRQGRKQICTCVGTCRGAEGLGEGWICALQLPCSGPETKDMVERRKGNRVELAIAFIGAWLVRGRYRCLIHRHDGNYRAIDKASKDEWNADSIVGLADVMGMRAMG